MKFVSVLVVWTALVGWVQDDYQSKMAVQGASIRGSSTMTTRHMNATWSTTLLYQSAEDDDDDMTPVLRSRMAPAAPLSSSSSSRYSSSPRSLSGEPVPLPNTDTFSSLSCNNDIAQQDCDSWTQTFGSKAVHTNRIVIECGRCMDLDFEGPELTLQQGIDVRGRLVFRNAGPAFTLYTSMLAVQGDLILASRKPVDGKPAIHIVMTGENDQYFEPIEENAMNCGGVGQCKAGKKAIVVAGGKIQAQGLPPDAPTWLKLHDVKRVLDQGQMSDITDGQDPNVLIVDKAVDGKWAAGAEVLVTSHTTKWDGHQVRTIESISQHSDPNYVRIKLDSPIPRPTTLLDDPRFAVEVALLSRNIVLEGGPDSNARHGGHLWFFHTPFVDQFLEGVEVRNFGQQGTLGRYPIHFHFCGDNAGSVVAKNTVRNSHQRAIVVHGTNNVRVEDNVVFDTKGHAIILEDGIETGNEFFRNLGAFTRAVEVVIPNNGLNGDETDAAPATFWMSNPSNSWIGNVAAGSESSGFWFELRLRGAMASVFAGSDPRSLPLRKFEGNVAHSNGDRGLRTYPIGYMPDNVQTLNGFLSYRNRNKGLFFHLTENVAVVNSIFADNAVAIDLDRAEEIMLTNVTIIGQTDMYQDLVEIGGAPSLCKFQDELVGMEIHTFVHRAESNGAVVRNVVFKGFEQGMCARVAHIKFDDETRTGMFDWFTTFEKVNIMDRDNLFDFCPAEDVGVHSYLIDMDGSLRENGSGPGSLISVPLMSFVDSSACQVHNEGCYAYCGVCFRTMRFDVNPSGTANIVLKVCKSTGSPCTYTFGFTDPYLDPTDADNHRLYNAHLPQGSYKVAFVDGIGGAEVWPSFVIQTFEDKLCPESFDESDIKLSIPSVQASQCNDLIKNGDFKALNMEGWLERSGGLAPVPNKGIGGSTAISDAPAESSRDTIVQFVDTRCLKLMRGRYYEIRAWVKLVNKSGAPYSSCNLDSKGCPEVRIVNSAMTRPKVALFVPALRDHGFQLLHGVFLVDQDTAESSFTEFHVERNRADFSMQIDDVSMQLMPALSFDDPECQENLVENGHFESGDAAFWSESSAVMSMRPGFSLVLSKGYGRVFVKSSCMRIDKRYEVIVKFRMYRNGKSVVCDPITSIIQCPTARLVPFKNGANMAGLRVADALETLPGATSSSLYGVFLATTDLIQADRLFLQLENFNDAYEYYIDSVSIQFNTKGCSDNMLLNSDMGMGVSPFWSAAGSGFIEWKDEGYGGSSSGALISRERALPGHGARYNTAAFLDGRCLAAGSTWEITAQIKVFDVVTGLPMPCNLNQLTALPFVDACPSVRITIQDTEGTEIYNDFVRAYTNNSWNLNGWNEFKASLELPQWNGQVARGGVAIQVCNFPIIMGVVVDDFVVRMV
ncbi:hypothetical protein ACA910_013059 [Epithemia clementina (nom. ined.)]